VAGGSQGRFTEPPAPAAICPRSHRVTVSAPALRTWRVAALLVHSFATPSEAVIESIEGPAPGEDSSVPPDP
jgi:hypothetical protein